MKTVFLINGLSAIPNDAYDKAIVWLRGKGFSEMAGAMLAGSKPTETQVRIMFIYRTNVWFQVYDFHDSVDEKFIAEFKLRFG